MNDTAIDAARRYVDTYNKGTDAFVEACTTEDFAAYTHPGGHLFMQGREALREGARGVLRSVPDRRIVVKEMIAAGGWVSAHVTYTGRVAESNERLPPAGETIAWDMLLVWLIRDGRIAMEHIFRG